MITYGLLCDLARTHREARLEEARMARLIKEAKAGKPRLRDRFLSRGGAFLILFGQKLKERYEPKVQLRPAR